MRRKPFKNEDRYVWEGWWECYLCGQNTWNALHHIISTSDQIYIPGDHNGSILNSAPLCNYPCHIGNESTLAKLIPDFLNRTKQYIENSDYELKPLDTAFLQTYPQHYLDNET